MASDALIDRLAGGLTPVRARRSAGRDLALLGALAVVELALLSVLGAMRPDLAAAMAGPIIWWKLAASALLAGVATVAATRLFAPDAARGGVGWRAAGVALAAGAVLVAVLPGVESTIATRLDPRKGIDCLASTALLGAPGLAALIGLARRGAVVWTRRAADAIGLAAGAWGAFAFAWCCPHDDPLYVVVWFALAVGLAGAAGRWAAARALRW